MHGLEQRTSKDRRADVDDKREQRSWAGASTTHCARRSARRWRCKKKCTKRQHCSESWANCRLGRRVPLASRVSAWLMILICKHNQIPRQVQLHRMMRVRIQWRHLHSSRVMLQPQCAVASRSISSEMANVQKPHTQTACKRAQLLQAVRQKYHTKIKLIKNKKKRTNAMMGAAPAP